MANLDLKMDIKGLNAISSTLFDWDILKKLSGYIVFTEYIGRGHRGVVFKAFSDKYVDENGNHIILAVKIPRLDTPKITIPHEGKILEKTNSFGVGPKVYEYSEAHMVMEYVDGEMLKDCIDDLTPEEVLFVIEETLRQCLRLDLHKIDHTEIQGGKHIMVSKKGIYIIDFDKAREHSPKNFTSAMSLLFGENYISKKIMHLLNLSEEKIKLFRKYAKNYKTLFKN